jgi:polyisoprenoid-binding protein YceI
MLKTVTGLGLIALCLQAPAALADPVTFTVNDPQHRDVANFTSLAPLELVQGSTARIFGTISIDDSMDLSKGPVKGHLEVDLRTLETGIGMRDEDMRRDFLETERYPTATFDLESVKNPPVLMPGVKQVLMTVGTFSVHGVSQKRTIPIEVVYFPMSPETARKIPNANLLTINTEFPVTFHDHNIKRPEFLFQKLSDLVAIKLNCVAFSMVKKSPK